MTITVVNVTSFVLNIFLMRPDGIYAPAAGVASGQPQAFGGLVALPHALVAFDSDQTQVVHLSALFPYDGMIFDLTQNQFSRIKSGVPKTDLPAVTYGKRAPLPLLISTAPGIFGV